MENTKEDIYRTTEEFKDPTSQKIYSHELSINKIEYQLNAISVIKDLKDSIKGLLKTQTDIIDIKKKANTIVMQLEAVTTKYDEVSKVLTNNSKETLKVISDEQKARKSDSEKVEAHIKAIESSIDTNQKLFNKSLNELENIRQEDLVKVATTLKLEIENENNSLLHTLYKANQKMDSSNSIPTMPETNIVISWLPAPEEFIIPIEEARLACLSEALLESMKEDSVKFYNESIAECKKLHAIENEVKTKITQCLNKLAQITESPEFKKEDSAKKSKLASEIKELLDNDLSFDIEERIAECNCSEAVKSYENALVEQYNCFADYISEECNKLINK